MPKALPLLVVMIIAVGLLASFPTEQEIVYVVLGDSLAEGLLACRGYPYYFWEWLRSADGPHRGKNVTLINLGQSGWTSFDLLKALTTEQQFRTYVGKASLITLDIGGNDLLYCNLDERVAGPALVRFRANLMDILNEVRSLNPHADLLLLDLYDPYAADPDCVEHTLSAKYIAELNTITRDVADQECYKVLGVACIYDCFKGRERELTWISRWPFDFHPNDEGHKLIAQCLISLYSRRAQNHLHISHLGRN